MRRLRGPVDGCEWDRAQTHDSLAPYAIEEAYELADAIRSGDDDDLRGELGDVALQVVFHAQVAADRNAFDLADVLSAVADKMERRHPHIFGDAERVEWDIVKQRERSGLGDHSALAGVAATLPALMRAQKLGGRAARVGFDWAGSTGVLDKVVEELGEIADATTTEERHEEFGDLLFTLVSWARHAGLDAETALRDANAKFERRFRAMESATGALDGRTADELEAAWQRAKRISALKSATSPPPTAER